MSAQTAAGATLERLGYTYDGGEEWRPPIGQAPDFDYMALKHVLDAAFSQASSGKGSERHASGQPFERQPILTITREEGLGFPIGQAKKKAGEAHRMADRGEHAAAERDLLGAIVYLAAAIIFIREKQA